MCWSTDTGLTVGVLCAVDVQVAVGTIHVEVGEVVASVHLGTNLLAEVGVGGLVEPKHVDLS